MNVPPPGIYDLSSTDLAIKVKKPEEDEFETFYKKPPFNSKVERFKALEKIGKRIC